MVSQIGFNPILTSNANGSFGVDSGGYIQGQALDSPNIRNQLAGGVLDTSEVLPMWGGVGVYENIPGVAGGPGAVLGSVVGRATTLTAAAVKSLTGFSVFDQAHHMVQAPQSEVPVSLSGMSVHFYRFGSNARIPVAVDPALISLAGQIITSQVSWDFGGQKLIAPQAAYAANVVTASSWANTNGGQASYTTTTAHGVGVGVWVTFSGFTPTGYNGTFLTVAGTAGSTIVVANPVNPGASTVQGTLVAGGGILPVRVRDVQATNCMTVNYNPVTGFATWNRQGACAVIII
jgi:hypothetical protein